MTIHKLGYIGGIRIEYAFEVNHGGFVSFYYSLIDYVHLRAGIMDGNDVKDDQKDKNCSEDEEDWDECFIFRQGENDTLLEIGGTILLFLYLVLQLYVTNARKIHYRHVSTPPSNLISKDQYLVSKQVNTLTF